MTSTDAGPATYLTFETRDDWRGWLHENHATADQAWLLHRKKRAALPILGYEEAVEEALCFGWIDGKARGVDDQAFAVRYSPRKAGSIWAMSNQRRVEDLIQQGRMTPAGLAKVAEAKSSGEWGAASERERVNIPPDLREALGTHTGAWESFQRWPASRKKQYLYWLETAKRPETRQKRLAALVNMAKQSDPPKR